MSFCNLMYLIIPYKCFFLNMRFFCFVFTYTYLATFFILHRYLLNIKHQKYYLYFPHLSCNIFYFFVFILFQLQSIYLDFLSKQSLQFGILSAFAEPQVLTLLQAWFTSRFNLHIETLTCFKSPNKMFCTFPINPLQGQMHGLFSFTSWFLVNTISFE